MKTIYDYIEEAIAEGDTRTQLYYHFLALRGINVPCHVCKGVGRRKYGSTATWNSRIGFAAGQAITMDVCDYCWGTGDEHNHGMDLRAIRKEIDELKLAIMNFRSIIETFAQNKGTGDI